MGTSFRNVGQIRALSGCDLMTMSPDLLAELANGEVELKRCLSSDADISTPSDQPVMDEPSFRFAMNQDAMATDKLSEGLR